MKTLYILCWLTLCPLVVQSQADPKVIDTKLSQVIVFTNGAQLIRKATIQLPSGESRWKMSALSPYLDPRSIQVALEGEATILAVNHQFEYLQVKEKDASAIQLNSMIEAVKDSLSVLSARGEVLKEIQSLLSANKTLGSNQTQSPVESLQAAIRLYDKELQQVKDEELTIALLTRKLKVREALLQNQLKQLQLLPESPEGQIFIEIHAARQTEIQLTASYYTTNAGWYPKYDVRVADINSPLELQYKAQVHQNTGEDWEDVILTFTNAPSSESGVTPKLEAWRLSYGRYTVIIDGNTQIGEISGGVHDENGDPLIGANVIIPGTTIGTITDINGRYALTGPPDTKFVEVSYVGYENVIIPVQGLETHVVLNQSISLSEVVVAGLSRQLAGVSNNYKDAVRSSPVQTPLPLTVLEKTTSVEFTIDRPYTISSDGLARIINLKDLSIVADYRYYSVPKLRKAAFLNAHITNLDQYSLLAGEANIYFENTFVGRSVIDTKAFSDTLSISLGVDKNIDIDRIKVTDVARRRLIGSSITENRAFDIKVKNNKSGEIHLTILDQIPLPTLNAIEVESEIPKDASLDAETGTVKWEIIIAPQQFYETRLAYQVKYPKSEKVYLE